MTSSDADGSAGAPIPSSNGLGLNLSEHLRPALTSIALLTLITGCIFPLVLWGLGRSAFPSQAGGSLVTDKGVAVGSRLIGQAFSRPDYFQTRPSAAGTGYDASSSGGTNLGPSNPKLAQDVRQFAADYRKANALAPDADIPIDAVTRSASGLDPHISPANAALQVARVAHARGLSEAVVARLVGDHTEGRQLGFMGQPRVSVLDLNLALDRIGPPHAH
jgi:K+-transporting ATPase ATPase C chain